MRKAKRVMAKKVGRRAGSLGEGLFSIAFGRTLGKRPIVVKRILGVFPEKEARQIIDWHEKYVETLKKFGVNVPATEIRLYPKEHGYRLTIFQERFEEKELVSEILKRGTRQEAIHIFENVSEQIADLIKLNQAWRKEENSFIWLDTVPANLAIRNGRVYLTDTFFPLIMIGGKSGRSILDQYLRDKGGFLYEIQRAASNAMKFEVAKPLKAIMLGASEIRPELRQEFEAVARRIAREEFSGKERRKMLRTLSPAGLKLIRAYRHFVQRFVLKQKQG